MTAKRLLSGGNGFREALMQVEAWVVNPLVERLLRSRLHWLASRRLLLLSYEGHVSGTRVTTPVLYERDVVVTTGRDEADWWKNFPDGHPATLRLDGEPVETLGSAILDAAENLVVVRFTPVEHPEDVR